MHDLDLAMFENKSVEFGCLTRPVSIVHLGANFFKVPKASKKSSKTGPLFETRNRHCSMQYWIRGKLKKRAKQKLKKLAIFF